MGTWVFFCVYIVIRRKGEDGKKEMGRRAGFFFSFFFPFGKFVFITYFDGMEVYLIATCTLMCHDYETITFSS